jgi:hypothetical protein
MLNLLNTTGSNEGFVFVEFRAHRFVDFPGGFIARARRQFSNDYG